MGYGSIGQNTTDFHDTYHSMQVTVNRRFSHGLSFAAAYTYGISLTGNTGLIKRYITQCRWDDFGAVRPGGSTKL